ALAGLSHARRKRFSFLWSFCIVRSSGAAADGCYDNALCESFFATLECELLDRRRFRTQVEARMAIFDFIEGWYNPHRRHSALDCKSPFNYERSHQPLA
ncbi:MAG: integrase core domain-containing protein, partial [Acidobacteriota bacterium]